MMDDELTRKLHDTASRLDSPLETDVPALLGRARVERRRHRRRTGAATVLLVSAVIVGSTFGAQAVLSDDTSTRNGPANAERDPRGVPVSDREIIDRCGPQLEKYASNRMFGDPGTVDWRVGNARDYHPGDIVPLLDKEARSNPVLCLLPEQGRAQDPVPWSALIPRVDARHQLAALCDATNLPQGALDPEAPDSVDSARTRDLRDAQITAVAGSRGSVEVLLTDGDRRFDCSLAPVTWDNGFTQVSRAGDGFEIPMNQTTAGSAHKTAYTSGPSRAIYAAAGTMPKRARSIELTVEGGTPTSYPVVDGAYAFVHEELTTTGLKPYGYVVRDADGNVLHSSSGQR